jgi:predicted house-cleaning noncanonical NTP pyrophosphatase (MazG superfamily)
MKAGLTTSHRTQLLVLSELLNSLEKEVEILHSKYCEAYVILIDVMERLARLTDSPSKINTTEEKDV